MPLLLLLALAMAPPPAPSLSLGNASDGTLVNGKRLAPRGASYEVMQPTLRRGYHWGGDELVGAIERASAEVARQYRGSSLLVGNMSREGGGDIGPSVSHNSGRDVDLGFYAMNTKGKPVRTPTLVVFDDAGVAGDLRFDARRNWSLVKAFLADSAVQVQWLFCKNALRAKLLAHARAAGEPPELIARAEAVLGEPGNSSAHAEHFHVRLYCARRDRLAGCRNYGPTHAWIDDYQADVDALALSMAPTLQGKGERAALDAAKTLALLRANVAGGALVAVVTDAARSRALRLAALEALTLLSQLETHADRLAAGLAPEKNPELLVALTRVVAHIAAPSTGPQLLALAARPKAPLEARQEAVRGLGVQLHAAAVPTLGALLGEPKLAAAAEDALVRLTGKTLGRGAKAVKRWGAWWSAHSGAQRLAWVWESFGELGVKAPNADASAAQRLRPLKRLVSLMRAGGARAAVARELVRELTDYWLVQGHFTDHQMYRFYSSWLRAGAPSPRPPG